MTLTFFCRTCAFLQEIGCLIGALSNLWIGDKLGRRKTIVLGGVIMIVGAILQATSFSYAQMVVARIVTGLGNGLNVGGAFQTFARTQYITSHRHRPCLHTTQSVLRLHGEVA